MKRNKGKIRANKRKLIENYGCKCMLCNRTIARENITYHHIIPLYAGGDNEFVNGSLLCTECHTNLHRHDFQSSFYQLSILLIKKRRS